MLPILRNGTSLIPAGFRPVNRLSSLFSRLFDEGFPAAPAVWSGPPVCMWEDENSVHVEADVPGMKADDIEASVHNGELVLRGERKGGPRGEKDGRSYGRFEYRVTLPAPVEADRVDGQLKDGVLTLTLPKAEQAKPRRIALRS